MRKKSLIWMFSLLSGCAILTSCSKDGSVQAGDNFDRKAMLQNWADQIIVPGYTSYVSKLVALHAAGESFTKAPSLAGLASVRVAWLAANIAWQEIAMFEIGKAEELSLINYTNIYPTNIADLIKTIESGTYDLASVNKQDEQGFPAIEYLIYGVKGSDQEIVDLYLHKTTGQAYKTYLMDLNKRLKEMAESILADWKKSFRDTFVNNAGSEATSSVNKLVNDYLYYYEKHLRAGKIGIPAGVFSSAKQPEKVEGLYSGKSKELFMAGLGAMKKFFNGHPPNSFLTVEKEGLKSYLNFVNTVSNSKKLAVLINEQFDSARKKAASLSDNFNTQVKNNNKQMLETYDELQKNTITLKVDMLQALNVRVDFVDADGD